MSRGGNVAEVVVIRLTHGTVARVFGGLTRGAVGGGFEAVSLWGGPSEGI